MKRCAWTVALWFSLACGSTHLADEDSDAGGCAAPAGRYFVDYTEVDGDCGEIEDRTIDASGERVRMFSPPCSGEVTWTVGNCMTEFAASCPSEEYGPDFYNEQHSVSRYNRDASERNGIYEQTVFRPDGGVYCHSIYEHSSRRISSR